MTLTILTPEQTLFSGEAESVSLPGTVGRFQVLNNHAPLISSLKKGNIKVKTKTEEINLNISGGFVEVLKNNVSVLVEGVEN